MSRGLPPIAGGRARLSHVAVRTTTITDEYGEHEIVAGRTFADAKCSHVVSHPDLWAPVGSSEARAAIAKGRRSTAPTRASSRRRTSSALLEPNPRATTGTALRLPGVAPPALRRPTVKVELLTTPGDVEICLARGALSAIRDECWAGRAENMEVGGGLYGTRSYSWHRSIDIGSASVATGRERGAHSIVINLDDLEITPQEWDGVAWRGIWHSHPDGDGTPSPTDLTAFAKCLDAADALDITPRFVAIIATPGDPRRAAWMHPNLHGWVVFCNRWSEPVCQAAAVTEPGA